MASVTGGDPGTLDLGTMGMAEQRNLHFSVVNENPVSLRLERWSANTSWCSVEVLRVGGVATQQLLDTVGTGLAPRLCWPTE